MDGPTTFYMLSRALVLRRYILVVMGAAVVVFLVALAVTHGHADAVAPWIIGSGFAVSILLAIVPTRVDLGAHGVRVSWLWIERSITYGEIASVGPYMLGMEGVQRRTYAGVRLTLRTGEEVIIGQWGEGDTRGAILDERIRASIAAREKLVTALDAERLRREDRDVGAWVAALRAIGAGAHADLRTAPMPRERLLRVLLDPSAAPVDRAAAAVAIGGDGDPRSRERLRAVADATVAPRLRVVIEESARGEDEGALEAALAGMTEEEPPRRA
jgi:hypothetical protein